MESGALFPLTAIWRGLRLVCAVAVLSMPIVAAHGQASSDPELSACLARPGAASSAGMMACVVRSEQTWSSRMDEAYRKLSGSLDPESRKLLEASQRSWERFRADELTFEHGPWTGQGGTIENLNIAALRLGEVRARARVLMGYLEDRK